MPRSVTIAVMRRAGVTSKAGFRARRRRARCARPASSWTSRGVALLDRDALAVGDRRVDRRERGGDVEGHPVGAREHREPVGPDLVRGVAVARRSDRRRRRRGRSRRGASGGGRHVRDHGDRDPVLGQLPGGQPRALEKRRASRPPSTRSRLPCFPAARTIPERGAVARGREPAGVAVGEDASRPPAPGRPRGRRSRGSSRRLRRGSPRPRRTSGPQRRDRRRPLRRRRAGASGRAPRRG